MKKPINRAMFLENTNEEELFSVFSSVLERIKQKKGYYLQKPKPEDCYFPTDKEIGEAIKQTLKDWGH